MIIRIASLLICLLGYTFSFAQGKLHGRVIDNKTSEYLPGVNIKINDSIGTLSDTAGRFSLSLPPGHYMVTISFVGYQKETREVEVDSGKNTRIDVALEKTSSVLNTVVVTGSKSELNISEEPVSIDVIKPELIKNVNSVTLEDAVNKVTGVEIMDNQVDIRGGSGFSFGVGSRVLLLLDDMPLLTVDRSEVKWDFIPLELADQVEVDKSAGSALYGASALNGIINVRTGYAGDQPETEISTYYTGYAHPSLKSAGWWDTTRAQPYRVGGYVLHKQRIGRLDIVGSVNGNNSIGYIRQYNTHFLRFTLNVRYRAKIPGLTIGLNTNIMQSRDGEYVFWAGYPSGLFIPYGSTGPTDPGSLTMSERYTYMLDPWLHYFDKHGNKHIFRNRYNHVKNDFPGSSFTADYIITEYQYQRQFKFGLSITAGVSAQLYYLYNPANFGIQSGNILSTYLQLEQTFFGRLHLFAGARVEHLHLDTVYNYNRVVGDAGLSIQAGKESFLRASFGQGYRVPSIAELFALASEGGVYVFPNPDLKPEYGFNSELGFKQGFNIGHFHAYFDVALFWMEYWDLVVFNPVDDPISPGSSTLALGLQGQNVSRARIAGYETSFIGEGKIGKIPMRWQVGYTYDYPADLSTDTSLRNVGNFLNLFVHSLASKSEAVTFPELNYRSRYLVKSDAEVDLWKFSLGADFQYYSVISQVDGIFRALIPGLTQFIDAHENGSFILGPRGSFNFGKYGKLSLILDNAINATISIRPAEMYAPFNYTFQYRVSF